MNEIANIKIAAIGHTVTGKTPSSNNPEDFGTEFMFVTPSDSFDSKTIIYTERYLSEEGVSKLSNKLLPPKSVMITCIGSAMGKVSMNKTRCITNQQINSIIPSKNYHPDYIYYSVKNNYKLLRNASTGSTALPLLNKTDFDLLELPIHTNKNTQQKIVNVLSSLDSKIELNNQINTELESMAKTLYDYWFVQFDFPNENDKPYKTSGGKMVWNEELKREIPEGWEVTLFSDWINNDKSGDWGREDVEGNYTERVHCIRGADINGMNGTGELKPPVRFILEKNMHKILEPYDLIVEISGGSPTQSTGRMAYVTSESLTRFDAPIICSNFCKAVTLKDKSLFYNFVFHWKSLYDAGVLFGYEGKTSGIKNLLFDSFVSSHYTVLPNKAIAKKFHNVVNEIENKRQKNLKENQKLVELRDWLLPMLMNGQVKVN
jgi:type I restriction enzyme, S subunit